MLCAGYSGDMAEMVAQNSGVKSRFPTSIHFDDYSADELFQIAGLMIGGAGLTMSDGAKETAFVRCAAIEKEGGRQNGNGRDVRNLVEQAKRQQALRLLKVR